MKKSILLLFDVQCLTLKESSLRALKGFSFFQKILHIETKNRNFAQEPGVFDHALNIEFALTGSKKKERKKRSSK